MRHIFVLVQRYQQATCFVLAHAGVLGLVLLTRISLGFGFLGFFTPAAAALIVTACGDGREGLRDLFAQATLWSRHAGNWSR
jgi:hypothetical protein